MMNLSRRSLLLSATASLARGADQPERTDLWRSGEGGYKLYRIPGLAVTKKGSILAYCEARKSDRGDWGSTDIQLRRSADAGRTFTSAVNMPQVEGPHLKNPVALAQNLADPDALTYNNPVAIPDRDGSVHFLFCLEYMRAFYTHSADDGRTWSKPAEITSCFDGFRPEYPWKVIATGPGHGIQLRNGRLLVPVWMSTGTGGHAHRPSVAATIYSDDHGRTWHRGEIAVPNTPEWIFPSETNAVELSDGGVMLNVRTESKVRRRLITVSKDGTSGWSTPRFQQELLEPVCFASLTRSGSNLVFSNPDSSERKNLTIQLSSDSGQTWKAKRVLDLGWAAYSDLAARGREILCLYERGKYEYLTLARFDLNWIRQADRSIH
jgi:sialidase-1